MYVRGSGGAFPAAWDLGRCGERSVRGDVGSKTTYSAIGLKPKGNGPMDTMILLLLLYLDVVRGWD